jgi:hypothetical protein
MIEPSFVTRRSPPYNTPLTCAHVRFWSLHLARSTTTGDVRASSGLLSTGDGVTAPSPVGARALTAENVDVGGRAGDGSSVLCHGESGNGYTSGRGA